MYFAFSHGKICSIALPVEAREVRCEVRFNARIGGNPDVNRLKFVEARDVGFVSEGSIGGRGSFWPG